ncbi:hypothetical protein TrRE_jg8171 [Triparma retinervis]|uniref:Uncharacterized protein n=1 Tax=Triparma retinervis TaxID=2557542 RepID=A0A9W6ZH57_9STRA|nr:hypothetical protein TrRE_jg8171 [Triparma retinervis]
MALFLQKELSNEPGVPKHLLEENQLPSEVNIALFNQASFGDLEAVKGAYKAGGKPNYFHRPSDGATSLHAAARSPSKEAADCINFLFLKGACLDVKMITNQNTPLHEAIGNNKQLTSDALIVAGASFLPNAFGNTPLHLAAQQGNISIALLLLQKNHPVNVANNRGLTPLHVCASLCKEASAPVSDISKDCFMKLASCLILYSANVDAVDSNKYSAMHLAAQRGNLDMVQLLADSGAKTSEKSCLKFGEKVVERTPAEVAKVNSHINVQAYLEGCEQKMSFGRAIATNEHAKTWTKGIISSAKIKAQKENIKNDNTSMAVGSGAAAARIRASPQK